MGKRTFAAGVNLGGWLSQYRVASTEHFNSFITEADIEQIAGWGIDHVRLPIDYPVFEDDAAPGRYREEGLQYIDHCLEWCAKRDLGVVLDLHHAPGYSFGSLDKNTLFDDEQLQGRFVAIWDMLARRYRSVDDQLQLELLNEVVEPTSTRWNRLAHRTIAAIRQTDPNRKVVYGGNFYNSIDQLRAIEVVPDDDNIVYTFHFYKPLLFTHQHASWNQVAQEYSETVDYPGTFPNLAAFLQAHPEFPREHHETAQDVLDASLLDLYMQPAVAFLGETGNPLYCGEFGVIENASLQSRINWHRDVVDRLINNGIGRAVWTYKDMNFPLVDRAGRIASEELVHIISRKGR